MLNKELSSEGYLKFSRFLESQCGIVLGDNKHYLVRSRLSALLNKYEFGTLDELVTAAMSGRNNNLLHATIDAMTTNETLWFRDKYPFELLTKDLIPDIGKKQGRVRIWSAACSSGQEPYSMAMSILEAQRSQLGMGRCSAEIVATDLSSSMLDKCRSGLYDELSLARGLPGDIRSRYFRQHNSGMMEVNPEVKRMVTFKSFNLLNSYVSLGKFDIVFCRNVLIYFSPEVKRKILQQIASVLQPGGILFLGASESISVASEYFDMVKCHPGLYYIKK